MRTALFVFAAAFIVASMLCAIAIWRATRRIEHRFNVVGVTKDRRDFDQKGYALARKIKEADAPIEREFALRVRDNERGLRGRRAAGKTATETALEVWFPDTPRPRLSIVHSDAPADASPFHQQAG